MRRPLLAYGLAPVYFLNIGIGFADLERAVLGPQSTVQARKIVAEVLFATGPESREFFTRPADPGQQPGGSQPQTGVAERPGDTSQQAPRPSRSRTRRTMTIHSSIS